MSEKKPKDRFCEPLRQDLEKTPPENWGCFLSHTRDEHRKQFDDLQWAGQQPQGPPNFEVGDVVEFQVGGFGVVDGVSAPHDGWPSSSYSTTEFRGLPPHKHRKAAWHYELDFKRRLSDREVRRVKRQRKRGDTPSHS